MCLAVPECKQIVQSHEFLQQVHQGQQQALAPPALARRLGAGRGGTCRLARGTVFEERAVQVLWGLVVWGQGSKVKQPVLALPSASCFVTTAGKQEYFCPCSENCSPPLNNLLIYPSCAHPW